MTQSVANALTGLAQSYQDTADFYERNASDIEKAGVENHREFNLAEAQKYRGLAQDAAARAHSLRTRP